MKCILALYCLGVQFFPTCNSANIVSFLPIAFYSHQAAFNPLWLELAKRGHTITLIQPDIIIKNNENITYVALNETHTLMEKYGMFDNLGKGQSILQILFSGMKTFVGILEYQLNHPGVQGLLKSEKKVDLFFTEYLASYGFALGSKFNAPMIGIVSMDGGIHSHMAMGNPTHPLMYPDKELMTSSVMTFKDRVVSTVFWVCSYVVMNFLVTPVQERETERLLGVTASTEEIVKDVSLVFTNANPLFNLIRPLGPKTVNIGGGVHILHPNPLPKCILPARMKCALIFLTFLLVPICQTANIVVFMQLPFYSHQIAFRPLWLELARRGHHITLIQPDVIIENNENITHIVLNETYTILRKYHTFDDLGQGQSIVTIIFRTYQAYYETFEYYFLHPGVQELLKSEKKVDLVFTEYLMTCGFALAKRLNAPSIGIVSMDANSGGHQVMGNPSHPLMYPDKDMHTSVKITFKERVMCTLFWVGFQVVIKFIMDPIQERATEKFLGVTDSTEELLKNASMLFINANPLFNVVRPLGPKTINIGGGVHFLAPQPLPEELQDYLDNAKNGVIYFSLGSSITSKQLSKTTKKAILGTFSRLPYKILWKFDEEIAGKSDNVKIMKWLPQQDILRHKNVKLFITQAGLQSMEESIFNYVPMIALPFYGDQHNNANKMVTKGFGLVLDHTKLDEKSFESAILEVLNNPKYRETTKRLADLVKDQPMTGLEKAVWWTEYVLRHGQTDHFRNPAIDMPWYQFLFLDIISAFLLIVAVSIYALIKTFQLLKWSLRKLYSMLVNKKKTKTN